MAAGRWPRNWASVAREAAVDAADGLGSDLSQAAPVAKRHGAPNLPVFAAEYGDCAARPGVVERHHLRVAAARLDVPDGGHGLVQPLRSSRGDCRIRSTASFAWRRWKSRSRRETENFNTDQGVQYTAQAFTGRLESAGVAISMDGRGRWMDNVFVERLWRTLKYEWLYLHDYATVRKLEAGLAGFFRFYDEERLHAALNYLTPAIVYAAA